MKNMYKWIFFIILLFINPSVMAQNNDQNSESIAKDFYARILNSRPNSNIRQIEYMHELLKSYSVQDQKTILFSKNAAVYSFYIEAALKKDRLDLITQLFELCPIWQETPGFHLSEATVGILITRLFSAKDLVKLSQAGYDASHLDSETLERIGSQLWSKDDREILIKVFGIELPDPRMSEIRLFDPVQADLDLINGSDEDKAAQANNPIMSAGNTAKLSYFVSTSCKESSKIDIEQFKNKIKNQMYDFINKTKPSPGKTHSFKFEQNFSSSCSVDSKFTFEFNNSNELLIHSIDGSINKISADEIKRLEVSQALGL